MEYADGMIIDSLLKVGTSTKELNKNKIRRHFLMKNRLLIGLLRYAWPLNMHMIEK